MQRRVFGGTISSRGHIGLGVPHIGIRTSDLTCNTCPCHWLPHSAFWVCGQNTVDCDENASRLGPGCPPPARQRTTAYRLDQVAGNRAGGAAPCSLKSGFDAAGFRVPYCTIGITVTLTVANAKSNAECESNAERGNDTTCTFPLDLLTER
jgi:hypothetical protein